jgi:hypothetical protein
VSPAKSLTAEEAAIPAKEGAQKLNRQERGERQGRRRKALPRRPRRDNNKFKPGDEREDNAKTVMVIDRVSDCTKTL